MEQEIVQGLIDRGMSPVAALGVVSRMRAESRLNPGINEIAPVVPGSRGGYGLNQWTGPRRVQYEQFAASQGKPLDDLGTQLDFTMWELGNTERRAGDALASAQTPEEAARIYMEQFLRPGVIHADMRDGRPNIPAMGQPSQATNALASAPPAPAQNAFAPQIARMDPASFMRQRNALAMQPLVYERRNYLGTA